MKRKSNSGEIDEIILVYTAYINSLKQEVVEKRILPIDLKSRERNMRGEVNNIEFEPSIDEVFEYLKIGRAHV